VVVIDASFYHQRPTTVDTLRKSLATPYFIALLSTYEEEIEEAEDYFVLQSPICALVKCVERGFQHLATLERIQELKRELDQTNAERVHNEEDMEDATKLLVEMAAQLQGEMLQNQALQAESIKLAKMDTVLQATGTLKHKVFNPLFAVKANTEGALKHLNYWLESGVSEVAPIIEILEYAYEGAERIQSVIEAFSKLVEPTTHDYMPGMPVLALQEDLELIANAS
jgi:hypothetical protein